jgi:hypothetical protein
LARSWRTALVCIWQTRDSGDAQDLPDLGQGEALVVEGDDDPLALAEPADGAGQDALHLLGLEHGPRVLGALVLQGVDLAEPVAALGADREQLAEGDHRHKGDLVAARRW